ncbi:abortive infection family protein [uncultured Lactobacillus sp.]|uniref:abortive infection family protein n=1 Tax=uncultured Lactobacillus sp. TaxID=153152 RepID=UPI002803ECBF|nr:abortive infection family protein [uncultured Lactobacillus sp.]
MEKYDILKRSSVELMLIGGSGDIYSNKANSYERNEFPYLSGPEICDLAEEFGLTIEYDKPSLSRQMYLDELIDYCKANNMLDKLASYFFSDRNLIRSFIDLPESQIIRMMDNYRTKLLDKINGLIFDTDYRFVKNGDNVSLKPKGSQFKIENFDLTSNKSDWLRKEYKKIDHEINRKDYSSALTKTETMIDQVLRWGVKKKGDSLPENSKFKDKFNKVAELYKIEADKVTDKRTKKLISGLNTIVDSINEMRNWNGDAHSHTHPIKIKKYHAY